MRQPGPCPVPQPVDQPPQNQNRSGQRKSGRGGQKNPVHHRIPAFDDPHPEMPHKVGHRFWQRLPSVDGMARDAPGLPTHARQVMVIDDGAQIEPDQRQQRIPEQRCEHLPQLKFRRPVDRAQLGLADRGPGGGDDPFQHLVGPWQRRQPAGEFVLPACDDIKAQQGPGRLAGHDQHGPESGPAAAMHGLGDAADGPDQQHAQDDPAGLTDLQRGGGQF